MTLIEAIDQNIRNCQGLLKAAQLASTAKPIVGANGQPLVAFKPPDLGHAILTLIQTTTVMLESQKALMNTLSGGFVLSDVEAARIADLLLERIQRADQAAAQRPQTEIVKVFTSGA